MPDRFTSVYEGSVCIRGPGVPGKDVTPEVRTYRIDRGPTPEDPIAPLERAYLAALDEADRVCLNLSGGRRSNDPIRRRPGVPAPALAELGHRLRRARREGVGRPLARPQEGEGRGGVSRRIWPNAMAKGGRDAEHAGG